ncbi:hypothetical protein SRDD_44800 [Serratia sp. DD3]|nr:hypothetical protein SRDD_44800 [Serratia sp. DD3]
MILSALDNGTPPVKLSVPPSSTRSCKVAVLGVPGIPTVVTLPVANVSPAFCRVSALSPANEKVALFSVTLPVKALPTAASKLKAPLVVSTFTCPAPVRVLFSVKAPALVIFKVLVAPSTFNIVEPSNAVRLSMVSVEAVLISNKPVKPEALLLFLRSISLLFSTQLPAPSITLPNEVKAPPSKALKLRVLPLAILTLPSPRLAFCDTLSVLLPTRSNSPVNSVLLPVRVVLALFVSCTVEAASPLKVLAKVSTTPSIISSAPATVRSTLAAEVPKLLTSVMVNTPPALILC